MPKPKKIKKSNHSQVSSASKIKSTQVEHSQLITFSYKYLKNNHEKFSISQKSQEYIVKYSEVLFERLRDISSMTYYDMTVTNARSLRCHPIDWYDTTETCFGLVNEEQLVSQPYQFQLSSNEYGRVHGFFIEYVFYIVWLDPDHLLYS
ncbi:MAG: hypothetical protein EAZ77_14545 [Nostocales cyanobacterium]|nr:MAG: hypothetical protein EAZ77_14545 [Nostocales cyanobacterium]